MNYSSASFHLPHFTIRPDKVGAPSPCVLGLWLILILILISASAPSRGLANPPVLVAGDGTYLGVVSANEYDPESTSNPFGLYGSAFSATSINNPYSLYGSEFSAYTATNSISHSNSYRYPNQYTYSYRDWETDRKSVV